MYFHELNKDAYINKSFLVQNFTFHIINNIAKQSIQTNEERLCFEKLRTIDLYKTKN